MEIVTNEEQLRVPTVFVDDGEDITEIVDNLFREMQERDAQGLAANQLGYDLSVFVMKLRQDTTICIVNPVITKTRGSYLADERCLSLPRVIVRVKRSAEVKVKGVNRYFKPVSYRFRGIEARRACHEIDHLLGKLITDYKVSEIKKLEEEEKKDDSSST